MKAPERVRGLLRQRGIEVLPKPVRKARRRAVVEVERMPPQETIDAVRRRVRRAGVAA